MSVFPNEFDTDQEIPRADAGVTEIDGSVVNSIRDAIFNIQKSLGLSPQGNKPSLSERIGVSIDVNGLIKKSALDSIGLATLPIQNSHVGSSAGILESKLKLDHSTQSLRNSISSLQTDVSSIQTSLSATASDFTQHTLGLSDFHDGYEIKINKTTFIGVGGLSATTVGAAINEIAAALFGDGSSVPHIDTTLPSGVKHTAAFISVDASGFASLDPTTSTVQEALDNIDEEISGQQTEHVDSLHSNGIFKQINSGSDFNANQPRIENGSGSYTGGTSIIAISGVTSFADLNVVPGDILVISAGTDAGNYKINLIGPKTSSETLGGITALAANELSVFYTFTETQASATVSIYQPASISSEDAPLACAVRHSETLVDSVSILNPDAARVVSIGLNGDIISSDGYEIHLEVGMGNGHVRPLTIPSLHLSRLSASAASPVSAESISERINAYVSDPTLGNHFPVTAFRIGNEIAIAHNLVGSDYTLSVLDGYTGNRALGLDAYGADVLDKIVVGNTSNNYSINGAIRSSLATLVDGYATITSSTETFAIYQSDGTLVDPVDLGIQAGAVLHITGHPTRDVNGSYTIESATTSNISLFAAEAVPLVGLSTTFNIKITDSNVSLNPLFDAGESDHGLVEIYVDENGSALAYNRITYADSLGPDVDIIGVSNGFPTGTVSLTQTAGAGETTFNIVDDSVSGTSVTVDNDFLGTFKLYHSNNIDYLVIIVNSTLSGTLSTDVTIYDALNNDEAMRICTVHFNGADSVSNLIDTRPFGNLAANQISDSFIEIFSQRPMADTRSDGVVRGFDLLDMPLVDTLTNMQAVPISGGTAYVNGTRVVVETQKAIIQSFDFNGDIVGNVRKVVGINELGSIRSFDDDLGEFLEDAYRPSAAFGRILPLYVVDIDSNGLIQTITDVRLFINNLDAKIDLIIDESNNVVGNFRSLEGALLYATNYPDAEKPSIRIINEVRPSASVTVPSGISIFGSSPYGGEKARIVASSAVSGNLLALEGNNIIRNIEIASEDVSNDGYLIYIDGPNVTISECLINFDTGTPDLYTRDYGIALGPNATSNVNILGNRIDNVFGGVLSDHGCNSILVKDNHITNVLGEAVATYGIRVGNFTNSVSVSSILNNTLEISTPAGGSLIRGIQFDVHDDTDVVRIENNNIIHSNRNTMSAGVRIENSAGTSGRVKTAIVKNNYVDGVALNSNNVFGMYINGCNTAILESNTLKNIGFPNNINTIDGCVYVGINTKQVTIKDNVIEDGYVLSGIEIASGGTPQVDIVKNVIKNVGVKNGGSVASSTIAIRCAAPRTFIQGNSLVGVGEIGIYTTAAASNCVIEGNNLVGDPNRSVLPNLAFLSYGIRILGSENTVINNTMSDMIATGSIGISVSSAAIKCDISNNSINGTLMSELIGLDGGSNHTVASNYLINDADATTTMIKLGTSGNAISNSRISDNTFYGAANYGIIDNSTAGVADTMITNNDMFDTTYTTRALDLSVAAMSGCMISGNNFPDSDASAITSTSDNVIGINRNLLDSFSVSSVHAGLTGGWTLNSTGVFIDLASASSGTYVAAIPLTQMPNGSTITSIDIEGSRANFDYTFTLYRIDHATNTASSLGAVIENSSSGDFSTSITSINSIIAHSLYRYVLIASATSVSSGAANDKFYSATVNIRY